MTTGRPGAVHLAFPFDTQKAAVDPDEVWAEQRHSHYPSEPTSADPAAVEAAVEALHSARNAVIVCGGGAVIAGAMPALEKLANRFNIAVATTVSGQGSIAETHPLALGVVGSNGGVPSTRRVIDEADLVLYIGCRAGSVTTERWRFPCGGTRIIHIDSDPDVIGANFDTEIALVGDARLALEAMLAVENDGTVDHNGRQRAGEAWDNKVTDFLPLAESTETPIRPERVIATLNRLLDDDAIIVADPGTPCPLFFSPLPFRESRSTLYFKPRARRAGLRTRGINGCPCRPAGCQDSRRHG